jgi:hypothetical protein
MGDTHFVVVVFFSVTFLIVVLPLARETPVTVFV